MLALTDGQVEEFVSKGFIRLERAFPRCVADECRELLWAKTGLSPGRPETWTEPLIFITDCHEEPFRRAVSTQRLHDAFDQLVGPGRWQPIESLGWFLIRFPGGVEPPDQGWHVDGSYPTDQEDLYGLNLRSRGMALTMLFLCSDVTTRDAPTRLRVGSHLDVPALLEPAGEAGTTDRALLSQLDVTQCRPVEYATGNAGDVYLCHPFLVHDPQPHHGTAPRFVAPAALGLIGELDLDCPEKSRTPVEVAVCRALGR